MKKIIGNTSPFLLLIIPFFVGLILIAVKIETQGIQERINMNASFISLPEVNIFNVLLRR